MDYGRCACSGIFERRTVEVTMTSASPEEERFTLRAVPQGACPRCGSRVYKAHILDIIETLMFRTRTGVRSDSTGPPAGC